MKLIEGLHDRESFTAERGVYLLGDARELIREVPTGSVDAVVTDPPWGVYVKEDPYDDFNAFLELRDELYRVMKPDSWLVFFFTPKKIYEVTAYLEKFTYKWMIPYLFLGYGSGSRTPLGSETTYSIVMLFAKGEPKVAVKRKDTVVADELPVVAENVREPQFKPTFVVATLLTMFTRPGDLVLDPFAGYGSIPLVCELFGRRWIAFDIDPVKFQIAGKIIRDRRVYNISRLKRELANRRDVKTHRLEEFGGG